MIVNSSALIPVHYQKRVSDDKDDVRFSDVIITEYQSYLSQPESLQTTIAILGVPQSLGVGRNGGRVGAELAPSEIRKRLGLLTVSSGSSMIDTSKLRIIDVGDVDCVECSLEEIHERQFLVVQELLSIAELVIVIGGGHDIAYPNGVALGTVSESIGVVNIDAHLDVRPLNQFGTHSGSPFRQLLNDSRVKIPMNGFIEFGIQPFTASKHHLDYVKSLGQEVHLLDEIRIKGFSNSINEVWKKLCKAQHQYCSVDIDGIASAYAPGVSAPAVDGFTPQEVIQLMQTVGSTSSCKLVDFVECNPTYDCDGRTVKLVATLIAHVIFSRAKAHGFTKE
jgi:formiminoglutamase